MSERIKDLVWGLPWYMYVLLGVAIVLLIVSWVMPPAWIIEKSVIVSVGMLLGFGWLYFVTVNIPNFMRAGARIRATKGDASIEITSVEDKDSHHHQHFPQRGEDC